MATTEGVHCSLLNFKAHPTPLHFELLSGCEYNCALKPTSLNMEVRLQKFKNNHIKQSPGFAHVEEPHDRDRIESRV